MSITLRSQRTSKACTITNSRGSHLLTIKWSNQILVILNHIIPITDITLWYGRLVEGKMKEHKSGLSHILLPDSNHPLLTWYLWSENISMTQMRIKIAWAWDVENTAKFWPSPSNYKKWFLTLFWCSLLKSSVMKSSLIQSRKQKKIHAWQ